MWYEHHYMHLFSISCINKAFLIEILSRTLYCGSHPLSFYCVACCVYWCWR